MVERDKLDTAILAAPVEVRNFQVHFERLRDGRQLHMIYVEERKDQQTPKKHTE